MKRALLSLTVILLLALLPLAPTFVSALPDYDVVNLGAADRARLLTLLNGSATDAGKKYVLQSDFTFNASELFETYFPGGGRRERSQYATFLSALDGNNKTITVNVDRGRMARPLFHNVGQPTGEALTVENLTLRYKGDVKVAAFMSGIARNAAFKNITVEVEGDVVASADYFADNANFYAHGFGFRAIDCSFENISLTVGDAYGGGIIGQTNRTIAERLESEKNDTATFAYGFFGELRNVSVDKVDIFVRLINATGDSGAVAAGFAGSVQAGKEGEVKNVTVSVKDAVLARQQADGALGAGAYGFARRFDKLSGALITVGSIAAENRNISAVTAARTEAAGFGGVAGEELAVGSNTVRVNEGIIVSSYGAVSASGGYIGALAEGLVFSTRDNIVEVIGDVRAKGGRLVPTESPLPDAVRVSGFYAGDGGLSSQNDKLYVSGALKAEAEGENGAVLSGFATKSRNIEGATILLGGISANSEGEVSVSGFTAIIEEEARQKNNYIRIGGNVEVSANKTAVFAGYSACLLEAGMTVENSCVNITGRVQVNCEPAETLDVEELAVSAAGFIRGVSGGSLMQNTAVIAGDLEAKGRALESADVLVAAFMCEALKGDVVNNAVLFTGTANAVSNIKNSAIKSNFIALLAEAAVKGNAVFGQAGLEKAPKDFFISAVESGVSSFSVTDNVYVAMLGDERVSHPLDFTVVNGKVNVKPKELLYPLASLNTKRISPSEFVLDDSLEGALSIFGLTRRDAVIIGSSNSISINRKSLMGSSENLLPFITVYSKVGGFITIRDILGAEAIQPKTVSGVIFYDNNNNGRYDSGDSYQPSVLLDVVVRNTSIKTLSTDRAGRFSFSPPLASAVSEDYRLVIQLPEAYTASAHSVNKFRDGVAVLPDFRYDKAYDNINGALTAPKRYSIEFIVSGGSQVKAQRVFEGAKVDKPDDPSREGYAFAGWYTDSAFGKQYEFHNPVFENLKLHAKWVELPKAIAFTLSYDGNGSTGGRVPEQTSYSVGDIVEIAARSPVRNGFTFEGWRSDYNSALYKSGDSFRMPSVNVSLSAVWSEILATYTVSFISEGGIEVESLFGVRHGSTIPEPEAPARNTYSFVGWFADEGRLAKWNFAKDLVQGDLTLYAKWDFLGAPTIDLGGSQSIQEQLIPLSGIVSGKWGISNLVFTLSCIVLAMFMVINAVRSFPTRRRSRSLIKILISLLSAAVALSSSIFFLVTTEFSKGAAVIDRWSWVAVLLAAAQVIFLVLYRNPEEE